jgi:Cu2+-exporting ATPase
LATALEAGSEHPLARALEHAAAHLHGALPRVSDLHAVTGQGVEARLGERTVRIGTPGFVGALHGQATPESVAPWTAAGDTLVALGDSSGWLACFRLADRPRSEASATVAALKSLGVRITLLSGDAPATVGSTAQSLGIQEHFGGMSPEDKHARIHAMQDEGRIVAMVGDGVNDAPVLAQAHVSVAMGGGTDLARSQGDVVLLSDNLSHLSEGVALARRTMRIVRQNLGWAFAYNFLAIPLAMAGWITPWMAGIGMSASSLLVVLNALRLQEKENR